jgi:hypothetical protein
MPCGRCRRPNRRTDGPTDDKTIAYIALFAIFLKTNRFQLWLLRGLTNFRFPLESNQFQPPRPRCLQTPTPTDPHAAGPSRPAQAPTSQAPGSIPRPTPGPMNLKKAFRPSSCRYCQEGPKTGHWAQCLRRAQNPHWAPLAKKDPTLPTGHPLAKKGPKLLTGPPWLRRAQRCSLGRVPREAPNQVTGPRGPAYVGQFGTICANGGYGWLWLARSLDGCLDV